MGICYVGGEPPGIGRYGKHKNVTRWLNTPKQRYQSEPLGIKYWFGVCAVTIACIAMLFTVLILIA